MFDRFKRKSKDMESVKENMVSDLAHFLMSYGFKSEDAFKSARDFWGKNMNRLNQVYSG